jgi:hypothetical protein
MFGPEYFLHASNITRVLSFSAKDIIWLRILAICGSIIGIPYFILQNDVLWEPIIWALVFIAINGYHVWRLWLERRPMPLSIEETTLYDLTFFPLKPRQFLELVRLGHWADVDAGEIVIRSGEPIHELAVPLTESIEGRVRHRTLGHFAAGSIIGGTAMFDARPSQLEAVASESCRVLHLPVAEIRHRATQDAQLARILEQIAREDLARKLERLIGLAVDLPRPT